MIHTIESLHHVLNDLPSSAKVSLVPTMGALHSGHLTLVEKAMELGDTVIVSIFVNPKQFNNPEDLEKYPRSLDSDVELLKTVGKLIVFAPTVDEIYPENFKDVKIDLGYLEETMEGVYRPGHFKGVVNVCHRLIDVTRCDYALFGLKDYQQLAVIQFMKDALEMDVEIVPCETAREPSGLASSSRNRRLSEQDAIDAEIIYKTMRQSKDWSANNTPEETIKKAKAYFSESPLELEYLEIVHPASLRPLKEWVQGARMCISAYCSGVRLIDNMEIIE